MNKQKRRLSVTFSDPEILDQIARKAEAEGITKSVLVDRIVSSYLQAQKQEKTEQEKKYNDMIQEMTRYFHFFIGNNMLQMDNLQKFSNRGRYNNKIQVGLENYLPQKQDPHNYFFKIKHNSVTIDLYANSLNHAILNKNYKKEVVKFIERKVSKDKLAYECNNIFYVILTGKANIIEISNLCYDKKKLNMVQSNEVNRIRSVKYLYKVTISYSVLTVAKILPATHFNAGYCKVALQQLTNLSFLRDEYFQCIDFSSIMYVSYRELKLLSAKLGDQSANMWSLLPNRIELDKGVYCISILNKPKSITQFFQKENIVRGKAGFVAHILPIYELSQSVQLIKNNYNLSELGCWEKICPNLFDDP